MPRKRYLCHKDIKDCMTKAPFPWHFRNADLIKSIDKKMEGIKDECHQFI